MFHLPHLFVLSTLAFGFFALQSDKKVTSDPNPFVQFRVGHKSFESKVRRCCDSEGIVASGCQQRKSCGAFC